MLVFLFVFTTMNGNWMAEFGAGAPTTFSRSLFRSTRFLNAICCKRNVLVIFQALSQFQIIVWAISTLTVMISTYL